MEKTNALVTYKSNDLLTFLLYDYYLSYQFTGFGNEDIIRAIEQSDFYNDEDLSYYQAFYGEGVFDVSYVLNGQNATIHPANMLNRMIEEMFYYIKDISLWPAIFKDLDIFTLDFKIYQNVLIDDATRSLLAFTSMQELCSQQQVIEETTLHL